MEQKKKQGGLKKADQSPWEVEEKKQANRRETKPLL